MESRQTWGASARVGALLFWRCWLEEMVGTNSSGGLTRHATETSFWRGLTPARFEHVAGGWIDAKQLTDWREKVVMMAGRTKTLAAGSADAVRRATDEL